MKKSNYVYGVFKNECRQQAYLEPLTNKFKTRTQNLYMDKLELAIIGQMSYSSENDGHVTNKNLLKNTTNNGFVTALIVVLR